MDSAIKLLEVAFANFISQVDAPPERNITKSQSHHKVA